MENKELYDSPASLYVLSTLMRNPLLLEDDKYAVLQTDFGDSLQQIVFISIYNLAKKGVSTITPSDIDLYLKTTPSQYDYYREHKGYDYVLLTYKTTEGSDLKQFDFYYERLKKFSLLRDLEKNGISIKDFYDISKDFLDRDLEDERLNNIKLQEIPNAIREKLVEIENKHLGKLNATAQEASKGLKELVADLKKNPEIGLPLDGKILNFAIRGARLGKLYLYSAASGMGKTRTMVGNACQIAMPFIKGGKIQVRDGYQKVLFMATEMAADEIQTLVLACVSGVNEEKILLGTCNPEEEKTIDEAIAIIEKYKDNFIIESMPDPSMAAIRARLTKYILQDGISYIFYDYIFSSPGLLGEFRDIDVREDVALMMLSNTLKEIAMTYNVFIMSATQLNGGWDKPGPRTANLIRGSKAISDKIDIGCIGVKIMEEEENMIADILKARPEIKPNLVIDIYKNRRGKMSSLKIFRYFDFGTCRATDLFVTDANYRKYEPEDGKIGVVEFETRTYDTLDRLTEGEKNNE